MIMRIVFVLFVMMGVSFGKTFPSTQLVSNQCFNTIYDNNLMIPLVSHNIVSVDSLSFVRKRLHFSYDYRVRSASPYMYTSSGYDRGHLVSAKENSISKKCYSESFKYSNIVPMTPLCNRKYWRKVELLVNSLVILNNGNVDVVNYVIPSESRLKGDKRFPIIPKAFIKKITIVDSNVSLCFNIPNLQSELEYKNYLKKNTSFRCVPRD